MLIVFVFLAGVTSGWCVMSYQEGAKKAAGWFLFSTLWFVLGAIVNAF
jgi:hypothetical protein